ncbi:MAG: hypothetical protein IJT84_07010 [Clostridia bacterium]|nr:hypothetical protein [Clostridia bacterium]
MDDLSQKLTEILNDEESMNKVRSLAENILSNNETQSNSDDNFGLSANELSMIMGIIGRLKNGKDDKRTALLSALKPNLSAEKQEKVDVAIKLLKLIEILPLLKESGILSIF